MTLSHISVSDMYPQHCSYLQYFVYSWVLCMVALASFLKLNYLTKTIILVVMVFSYGTLYSWPLITHCIVYRLAESHYLQECSCFWCSFSSWYLIMVDWWKSHPAWSLYGTSKHSENLQI